MTAANENQRLNIAQREKLATQFVQQKKWDKVIELLNPHTDETSPHGFLLMATSYQETKDFQSLVRIMKLLAEKRPKDPHVQFMLGDALLQWAESQKDLREKQKIEGEGIEAHRGSIRLRRSFRPPYQALVNYFSRANLNHEAREQLMDMIKAFGQKGELYADLCRLYSIDGFLQQAIKHCSMAKQLAPDYPESYVYLAQTYFDQKEMEKAESTLVQAAKRFPTSEFVQYGAGQFFLKKSNFPVASKYLQRAVASNANSNRSQLALAQSLFESGQDEAALPHFVKACQILSSAQAEVLTAASRLRLKGNSILAGKYAQAAGGCKRP